jgi:hypothetical protein
MIVSALSSELGDQEHEDTYLSAKPTRYFKIQPACEYSSSDTKKRQRTPANAPVARRICRWVAHMHGDFSAMPDQSLDPAATGHRTGARLCSG